MHGFETKYQNADQKTRPCQRSRTRPGQLRKCAQHNHV